MNGFNKKYNNSIKLQVKCIKSRRCTNVRSVLALFDSRLIKNILTIAVINKKENNKKNSWTRDQGMHN